MNPISNSMAGYMTHNEIEAKFALAHRLNLGNEGTGSTSKKTVINFSPLAAISKFFARLVPDTQPSALYEV